MSIEGEMPNVDDVCSQPVLEVEQVPVDDLLLLEGNPRRGDVPAIARSLAKFGQRKPVVVNRPNRQVLAGNHTLLAARSLGWQTISVCWTDDDAATAAAYSLADNRTAELGDYDNELLVAAMADVLAAENGLFEATGWSQDDLLELIADLGGDVLPDVDPDAVPDPPAKPFSKPGQVWQLGMHRVICGSATDLSAVKRLLAKDVPAMVWTDPPYNVDYHSKAAGGIQNDNLDAVEFANLIRGAMNVIADVVAPGGAVYVAHADTTVFAEAYVVAGLKLSGTLIWLKNAATLGRSDYQWRHEPILYGWKTGARHRWYGGRKQTTLTGAHELQPTLQADGSWVIPVGDRFAVVSGDNLKVRMDDTSVIEVPKPARSALHPTTKPTELIERHLKNSSRAGDVVLDCFGGSGSTLIACERTMRSARLVELDPKFVDVICRRWQDYTGQVPVLEETGAPHDFLS
jgi:DNA modification methylase